MARMVIGHNGAPAMILQKTADGGSQVAPWDPGALYDD